MKPTAIAMLFLIACSRGQDPTHIAIGDLGPDVRMRTVTGEEVSLADFRAREGREGRPVIVVSWSYRCPTGRDFQDKFREIADWCREHDVPFVAVCSYGDTEEEIREVRQRLRIQYPIIHDPDKRLLGPLGVRTVTHTFVLDREGRLRYRGAIDNSNRRQEPYAGHAIEAARAILEGREISPAETRPFG